MINKLPVFAEQQNPDDTIAYVGRGYIEFRNAQTKQVYIVYNKPKAQPKKRIIDEDEQRYEHLAGRY